jgi:hypothetical protein
MGFYWLCLSQNMIGSLKVIGCAVGFRNSAGEIPFPLERGSFFSCTHVQAFLLENSIASIV